MLETEISISSETAKIYIHPHEENQSYIISIPLINFSLEYSKVLSEDDQEEIIVAHLFHMMDEAECETIAREIIKVTAQQ